jgi:hypothetical protein
MTKDALMKTFEAAVDEAVRTQMWGEITVSFSNGEPAIMRTEKTVKLKDGGNGNNHANKFQR